MASSTAPVDAGAPKPQSSAEPKLTLYWLNSSRSHRILWLLEELQVSYNLKTYTRQSNKLAPEELKQIHPLGKAPVLTVQSADPAASKPLVIAESGAIMEYLLDHHGPSLIPTRYKPGLENQEGGETEAWLRYRQLMHYAEGSIMPLLTFSLILGELKGPAVPFLVRPISRAIAGQVEQTWLQRQFKTHLMYLEGLLESKEKGFLCGEEITGADFLMEFPLLAATGRAGLTEEKYPKLWAYVERLHGRDGYKRAVAKAEKETGQKFDMKL
jgi:glutathione S-transferase